MRIHTNQIPATVRNSQLFANIFYNNSNWNHSFTLKAYPKEGLPVKHYGLEIYIVL